MTTPTPGSIETVAQPAFGAKAVAALAGVLLVSLGAQAAVPLPGNPVPITLQVPAVLIVGGLLGPALGSNTSVTYDPSNKTRGLPYVNVSPAGSLRRFKRQTKPSAPRCRFRN